MICPECTKAYQRLSVNHAAIELWGHCLACRGGRWRAEDLSRLSSMQLALKTDSPFVATNHNGGDCLKAHRINDLNNEIEILPVSTKGPAGAYRMYQINSAAGIGTIKFHEGPGDPNGITHEVLLAILIDRLEGFQSGPYRCRENALALTKLQEALHWLEHRTRDRESRGVEGRQVP